MFKHILNWFKHIVSQNLLSNTIKMKICKKKYKEEVYTENINIKKI